MFGQILWFEVRVCNARYSSIHKRQLALYHLLLKKGKRIPFIFNDKSTGSSICLRLDLYLSHVKKHYTIITWATAVCFCFYLCYPTPPITRSHTCAYVTRMKDNFSKSFEPCHVIPDTRISSGQCPRCDVNVTLGSRDFQGHTK
jgi:hypothetical protein